MKQKEIVLFALKAGYDRFHPDWFVNNELSSDSWLCEITLLQKWLREYCWIHLHIEYECIDSETYEFAFTIKYFPKELEEKKRTCERVKVISSFSPYGGTYSGAWDKYEDALNAGVLKSLIIALKEQEV
jgi:hypothetical protein